MGSTHWPFLFADINYQDASHRRDDNASSIRPARREPVRLDHQSSEKENCHEDDLRWPPRPRSCLFGNDPPSLPTRRAAPRTEQVTAELIEVHSALATSGRSPQHDAQRNVAAEAPRSRHPDRHVHRCSPRPRKRNAWRNVRRAPMAQEAQRDLPRTAIRPRPIFQADARRCSPS